MAAAKKTTPKESGKDSRLENWKELEFAPALNQYRDGGVNTAIITYGAKNFIGEDGAMETKKEVVSMKNINISLDPQGRGYFAQSEEEAKQLLAMVDAPNALHPIVLYKDREAPKEIKSLESELAAAQKREEAKDAELEKLRAMLRDGGN